MILRKKLRRPSKLIWFGPVYSYSGYAQHNRGILLGLDKLGYNCYLIASETHVPEGLKDKGKLIFLANKVMTKDTDSICINLIPPPALPYWSKYTILYTTLESKTVHEGFALRCNQYDEVWVPCKDNYESLRPVISKHIPVKIVPEGVDTIEWNPMIRRNQKYLSQKFTFMFSGDWSYRKGQDLLIKAFATTFKKDDPVRLILHTHYQGNGKEYSMKKVIEEIKYFMELYNIKSLPEVVLLCDHYSDAELPSIYKLADVGLFPTRGEAWLLPAIQMMSMSIPVITTAYGGQTDFAKDYYSYHIKVKEFRQLDKNCQCDVDFYRGQLFAEPDFDDLCRQMKRAYTDRIELINKGRSAALEIAENFDWWNAVRIVDKRLCEINSMHKGTL